MIKTEEKGTDVNLATHPLLDAFDGECDAALVISNDSDLTEPIRQARRRFKLTVGVVLPILNGSGSGRRRSPSRELTAAATFDRRITNSRKRRRILAECQFPETLTDARGSFSARRGGHERRSNTATLASAFDLHGDDVDVVVLAVLHGRGVVPQQAERELAVVLDLGLIA